MILSRRDRQRGAALVLFLGVAAALTVLSVALVLAVSNARSNTSRQQRSTKSFDVSEAALDVTMQQLAHKWPRSELRQYDPWTETENPDFAADFFGSATPSPLPGGAHYVSVRVFDDVQTSTVLPVGWEQNASTWDDNGNGVMLVDAQARVGDRASRIRGTVRAVYYRLGLARGVAVWADGALNGTGSGNDPNITAEVLAFNSYQAMAHANSYDPSSGLWDPGLITKDPPGSGTQPPITQDTVDALVQIAKNTGRYFSGAGAEGTMKTTLANTDPGPYEGLCVLDFREAGSGPFTVTLDQGDYNCTVTNNGQQTLVEYGDPGALLILGGNLVLKGGLHYYGMIYVEGNVGVDESGGSLAGKPVIHGLLICMKDPDDPDATSGDIDLKGRAQVRYNANAARDLDTQFLTGVQLIDNGWRELQPTPAP